MGTAKTSSSCAKASFMAAKAAPMADKTASMLRASCSHARESRGCSDSWTCGSSKTALGGAVSIRVCIGGLFIQRIADAAFGASTSQAAPLDELLEPIAGDLYAS